MKMNRVKTLGTILWLGGMVLVVSPKSCAQGTYYYFEVTFCNQTLERIDQAGGTDQGTGVYFSANCLAGGIATNSCDTAGTGSGCGGDWAAASPPIPSEDWFRMGDVVQFSATGASGAQY